MYLKPRDPDDEPARAEPEGSRPSRAVRLVLWATRPVRTAWRSPSQIDDFALVHWVSVMGDTFVAIALADSIFFSVPVGEASSKVALSLALTMAPLALAGIVLVPLLDRAGPRRLIAFGAAAGRAALAVVAARNVASPALFPIALGLLVLTKIHGITKNGLTLAYAEQDRTESLVQANARLARWGVAGAVIASGPAILVARFAGSEAAMIGAAAMYAVTCLFVLRLPHPRVPRRETRVTKLGKMAELRIAAAGMVGLRMANGFLILLLAFAARRPDAPPLWWFGVLAACATGGLYIGDFVAPRIPQTLREETIVLSSLVAAGIGGFLAFGFFELWMLAPFCFIAGMAGEFGRLAFQSMAQKLVPDYAHGRVFVRYEVLFQLAWVGGAFLPALLPIDFRLGILMMGAFYLLVGVAFVVRPMVARARAARSGVPFDQDRE